jgi:hypothetical protein
MKIPTVADYVDLESLCDSEDIERELYNASKKFKWRNNMSVKKFKKKPVVIEAVQYTGDLEEVVKIGLPVIEQDFLSTDITIPTLEGRMTAKIGDWIIKGIKGEFYPCKPDIFEMTYEEIK